jgi:hypothetical protein
MKCNYTEGIKGKNSLSDEEAVFNREKKPNNEAGTYGAENRMWHKGVVEKISAGYGSTLDGDQYIVAICDDCIKEKREDGTIAFISNYMMSDKSMEDELDKYRKIWRRSNNLNKLI